MMLSDLCALPEDRFDDSFTAQLPADPSTENVPRQVPHACYTWVQPTPVRAPRLLGWADAVGERLGVARPDSENGCVAQVLSGNRLLPGMKPYAARYAGHQFGQWAGQLGDGRAITLCELLSPDGARWDIQLKGAGPTPYSRRADGRAVLRSSLREFLCSEAMHALGVPTTRALSLVATGEMVVRDMFYDGNPQPEPGAIVCRVAPSFIRFGHFEMLAANGETDNLRKLAEYVLRYHYPEFAQDPEFARDPDKSLLPWFREVCRRTAVMVAHWMRVGFVHGVMNTDNMSILGLTIDYGPYGWLEGYEPSWTPNTTDAQGRRYCFGRQPEIAQWNLVRLAEALSPLFEEPEALRDALDVYRDTFQREWSQMLAAKLGLRAFTQEADATLIQELFELLQVTETDMTIFFRNLARVPVDRPEQLADDGLLTAPLLDAFYVDGVLDTPYRAKLAAWLRQYSQRVMQEGDDPEVRRSRMNAANPKYVFRNYLAQLAIDATQERGDTSVLERLMRVLSRPYDEQPDEEDLAARRPEWARHRPGCSALSCSS